MTPSPVKLLERAAILYFAAVIAGVGFIVQVFQEVGAAVFFYVVAGSLAFVGITGKGLTDKRRGLGWGDRIAAAILLSIGGFHLYAAGDVLQRTLRHPSRDEYSLAAVLAIAGVAVIGGTAFLLGRKAKRS